MKKIALILVLFSALLASRWLFKPGYFLMHDDLQMMRQLQMEKCWQDRQIPCRWVPDMGFGYGYPLFNFYPPLPYYIGQIFRWLGFSFVATVKLVFALQFFLSGVAMFILASDLWGISGGLLSSVFYIWAPYHSVDVYVRGAMNEAWAFIWFPLIFWAAKKMIEKVDLKYLSWLSFSYAMLFLTHNVMAMIFTPAVLAWILYWMVKEKKLPWQDWKLLGRFVLSGFWALGLAAFFTLPMFFEKKYAQVETMFSGYFDWRAHFVSLRQLFISRFWGWGPSVWGLDDGMPFPVGHIHWVLGLIIILVVFYKVLRSKIVNYKSVLLFGFFFTALAYTFLAHQRSVFIWKIIKPLQLAQFSWRLLAGTVFFFSLLAGAVCLFLKKRWLVFALLVLVIGWNWNFFKPGWMGPVTDEEKFSDKAWELQQTAGIYDYLPKTASKAPTSAPEGDWLFLEGEVENGEVEKGTNWLEWKGNVKESGLLQVSVFRFPGWKVWIDYDEVELTHEKELGRMLVKVDEGKHKVYFRFTNTPIRSWSNLISLLSWGVLLLVILRNKWRKITLI